MRRLWAYIILAVTSIALVAVSFGGIFANTASNIHYEDGREITFKITDKDDETNPLDENAAETIADEMVRRLELAKVSQYELQIQGDDMIKVILSRETSDEYNRIATYLSFNGSLALSNYNQYILAEDFMQKGKEAYIDDVNSYPAIVLPVDTSSSDYTQVMSEARDALTDEKTEAGESSTDSEGNTTTSYYLYLWYDFQEEYCSFDALNGTDSTLQQKAQEHLLMKFKIESDEESQYFPDDKNNKLFSLINLDANGDGYASVKERENAYANARFYVNLINAGELDYKVTTLLSEPVIAPAGIEALVSGDYVAFSGTLVAAIFAVVLAFFIITLMYETGSLAILATTLVSVFVGGYSLIWFSAEFSVFGLIALILVAIGSIASGIVYLQKLKDESYKGRTLKKANLEAAKKSLLPVVDINVVIIIVGVFSYVFGGAVLRTFAAITVIGGLASLILNLLAFRGLMWLATNATCMIGRYDRFGMENENIPNLIQEEKQRYFGKYADKDFTAKKKTSLIVACTAVVVTLASMITFGAMNNGKLYREAPKAVATQLYVETTTESSAITENYIKKDILSNLMVYQGEDNTSAKALSEYIDTVTNPSGYSEMVEGVEVNHYIYIVSLKGNITEEWNAYYKNDAANINVSDEKINDVLESALQELNVDSKASLKLRSSKVYVNDTDSIKFGPIALASIVSIAVLAVYFCLRYRLSRGLTSLVVPAATSVITMGLLSLLRFIPGTSLLLAAVPVATAVSMIYSVILMNREREMVLEDKDADTSVENRNAVAIKAISASYQSIVDLTIVIALVFVSFLAMAPAAAGSSTMFALAAIGAFISLGMVAYVFMPIAQFFYKTFRFKPVKKAKKSKKNTKARTNKSAEPEEAIFIGIND